MVGYFNEKGYPIVKINVRGIGKSGEIISLIDTGFSGYLSIPVTTAIQLGLAVIGVERVQYADGRIANELVFLVAVDIDGKERGIPATLTWSPQALAGIKLFSDYSLKIDFKNRKIEILKVNE